MTHEAPSWHRESMDVEKLARIGAVVVGWAMIEYALERIVWALTLVSRDVGQRNPAYEHWSDKQKRILKLLEGDNSRTASDVRRSMNSLEGLAEHRNRVAHGVWLKEATTGALMVARTRLPDRKAITSEPIERQYGAFPMAPMTNEQLDDLRNVTVEVAMELMGAAEDLENAARRAQA